MALVTDGRSRAAVGGAGALGQARIPVRATATDAAPSLGLDRLEGKLTAALKGEPRRLALCPARRGTGATWAGRDPVSGGLAAAQATAASVCEAARRVVRRPPSAPATADG